MISVFLFILLIVTRLIGLDWGFPYYFHPDENNMAIAINNLSCNQFSLINLKNCFDPNFYAYGQVSLYLGAIINIIIKNANLSLRIISSFSSILSGFIFYKWIRRDLKSVFFAQIGLILFTFTPVFIQSSHFGTTESLLTLLFLLILASKNRYIQACLIGLSAAVKISSLNLVVVLAVGKLLNRKIKFKLLLKSFCLVLVVFWLLSPHYFLNLSKFVSSFWYETNVANGSLPVFYTEQFRGTIPVLFQILKILPVALGWPILLMALSGLYLQVKNRKYTLPLIFLSLFIPSSFIFAKWTRFLVYSYPLLLYFSVYALSKFDKNIFLRIMVGLILIIQVGYGLGFLTIYTNLDTRLRANNWLRENIKTKSVILTESANVIEIPKNYSNYNFYSNFLYELNSTNYAKIKTQLDMADYVLVPSRRVFANYTCFYFVNNQLKEQDNCLKKQQYPYIDKYYRQLFLSGNFKLVKTFGTFLNDENFEETWSVFDHPVMRIYQRIN